MTAAAWLFVLSTAFGLMIGYLWGRADGRDSVRAGKLPCDVMVAPRTVIRRGCDVSTVLMAISRRKDLPDDDRVRIKLDAAVG